jgi:hypothetical protein
MATIGENKGITADSFTNEHKGHLASFMSDLLNMTVREFVYGYLNDCRIIKFFKASIINGGFSIVESPAYNLTSDGGKLLSYLYLAEPSALGFVTTAIMLGTKEVTVKSVLGSGGSAVVYAGLLDAKEVRW